MIQLAAYALVAFATSVVLVRLCRSVAHRFGYVAVPRADRWHARPTALLGGVRGVGDPIVVLPVLYHLLWRRILAADLETALLAMGTTVCLADATAGGGDADAFATAAGG